MQSHAAARAQTLSERCPPRPCRRCASGVDHSERTPGRDQDERNKYEKVAASEQARPTRATIIGAGSAVPAVGALVSGPREGRLLPRSSDERHDEFGIVRDVAHRRLLGLRLCIRCATPTVSSSTSRTCMRLAQPPSCSPLVAPAVSQCASARLARATPSSSLGPRGDVAFDSGVGDLERQLEL